MGNAALPGVWWGGVVVFFGGWLAFCRAAAAHAEFVDVVGGGAGFFGGVGDHGEVLGAGESAFVGVHDVEPDEDGFFLDLDVVVGVGGAGAGWGGDAGGDAGFDFAVEVLVVGLPFVELFFVVGGDVVEGDEDAAVGVFDDGGEGTFPTGHVFAGEGESPSFEPGGAG